MADISGPVLRLGPQDEMGDAPYFFELLAGDVTVTIFVE